MAGHRYWRLTGLSTQGQKTDLALTEIKLLNLTTHVNGLVTTTSNIPPKLGTLEMLTDSTLLPLSEPFEVVFENKTLPILKLSWDLSTDTEVSNVSFGSGFLQSQFLLSFKLEYSDDNLAWTLFKLYAAPKWPGSYSLTLSDDSERYWDKTRSASLTASSKISQNGKVASPSQQHTIFGGVYNSTGVRQFEVKFTNTSALSKDSVVSLTVGLSTSTPTSVYFPSDTQAYGISSDSTTVYVAGATTNNGPLFVNNDVIGFVANFVTGYLDLYKNGVFSIRITNTGLLGKSLSPRVGDLNGTVNRLVSCALKVNSFDFPVAGASDWDNQDSIIIDPFIFLRSEEKSIRVAFANAASAVASLVPKSVSLPTQGNYLDPGKGTIKGTVKNANLTLNNEDLALPNLLFASYFSGENGTSLFRDEKGNNITRYGDCKIALNGVTAINTARSSSMRVGGGLGNGIRIPISTVQNLLNLSTGDFTIRTWYWLETDVASDKFAIFNWGGGNNYSPPNIRLQFDGNTGLQVALRSQNAGVGAPDIANFVSIPNAYPGKGQWVHLALTRENSLFRLWVAGIKKFEVSSGLAIHDSSNLTGIDIGSAGYDTAIAPAPSGGANGYFDDFQIFSRCLYSADFTPDVTKEFSLSRSGVPVRRRVELFRESDGMLIRRMWSDPITGLYKFEGLSQNYKYTVVAYDHTNEFKASIVNGKFAF
jgi:hypothetical protein